MKHGLILKKCSFQNTLYSCLMALRSTLAAEMDCMPYMIANNKTLLELAKQRPTDKQQLSKGIFSIITRWPLLQSL